MQGSSVSGFEYTARPPSDEGGVSNVDMALDDPDIFGQRASAGLDGAIADKPSIAMLP